MCVFSAAHPQERAFLLAAICVSGVLRDWLPGGVSGWLSQFPSYSEECKLVFSFHLHFFAYQGNWTAHVLVSQQNWIFRRKFNTQVCYLPLLVPEGNAASRDLALKSFGSCGSIFWITVRVSVSSPFTLLKFRVSFLLSQIIPYFEFLGTVWPTVEFWMDTFHLLDFVMLPFFFLTKEHLQCTQAHITAYAAWTAGLVCPSCPPALALTTRCSLYLLPSLPLPPG